MDDQRGSCLENSGNGPSSNQRVDGNVVPPSYNPENSSFPGTAPPYDALANQSFLLFNGGLLLTSLPAVQPIPWQQMFTFPGQLPTSSSSFTFGSRPTPPDHNPSMINKPNHWHSTNHPSDSANDPATSTIKEGSWAGRNPSRPVIPVRSRQRQDSLSENEKTNRANASTMRAERRKALEKAVQTYLEEQKAKAESIGLAHGVTTEYVLSLAGGVSARQPSRKPQLQNALVHAKAKEVNSGLPEGQRYTLNQIRDMIARDPAMQNLSDTKKQEYIDLLAEYRDTRVHGVRANNAAAARDVLLTTDRIVKDLDSLRERTGIYATLFITRSHINDTIQATWYATDNSTVFWEDVFKHSAGDIARQYEQWACAKGQNLEERDSLQNMRKQTTAYVANGLKVLTGKPTIAMNYSSYETSIIDTYGVKLVGWPADVPFTNPSNIGTVGETRKLRDALRSGACHWKRLTKSEREAFTAELTSRHIAGEQIKKPRKKRSDIGGTHKRKSASTAGKEPQKSRKKKTRQGNVLSAETVEDSDGSEADEIA